MAATRTQGITVDTNGNFTIDKENRGVRIYLRLGRLSQEDTEHRLDAEITRVESELEHKVASRPRFADCAARYLTESQHKRSVSLVAWHIRLLYPYLGNLEVNRVHDRALEPFITDRRSTGVTATTINRSLEVVRTILNRAARAYRDDDGRPWLDAVPPVVILNDAAWSIVQAQRGLDPIWVFPCRGQRMTTMNNTAWQRARQEVGLRAVRIHDLRHTFACRLRAAGVSAEDREALLGHANHSMAGHYASADVGRLLKQANLVLNRQETRTVLRVANRRGPRCG
jgi:hypothetical protein